MGSKTKIANALLERGLFPEVLPPCFDSRDCSRCFRGLRAILKARRFNKKRNADPIPYNGTKHDGSRRFYSTPHLIPYSDVSAFIGSHWKTFVRAFQKAEYSISTPTPASDDARAISVTPLSQVSSIVSKKLRFSPFVLRADIAQFYPSIYTHIIPWAAHGKIASKKDRSPQSNTNKFNALDFFVQNTQCGQTKGVLIGPDAFRIIAELVAVAVDKELARRARTLIIGTARHVDDYYIGVRTESDAAAALSHLREALHEYELNINDLKTKILPATEPFDDPWAAELRRQSNELSVSQKQEEVVAFVAGSFGIAQRVGSQSPVKLAVRRLDRGGFYKNPFFEDLEGYLQRIVYHFPHVIDYVSLLIAKRVAIGESIDRAGWTDVINAGLSRHVLLGHHHESCWLFWLAVVCDLPLQQATLDEIPKQTNLHLIAMLIQATVDRKVARKPRVKFGDKLDSEGGAWLVNLISRSSGFTRARFGGAYADELEFLSRRKLRLISFSEHMTRIAFEGVHAITNVRFGYEDDETDEEELSEFEEPDDPF